MVFCFIQTDFFVTANFFFVIAFQPFILFCCILECQTLLWRDICFPLQSHHIQYMYLCSLDCSPLNETLNWMHPTIPIFGIRFSKLHYLFPPEQELEKYMTHSSIAENPHFIQTYNEKRKRGQSRFPHLKSSDPIQAETNNYLLVCTLVALYIFLYYAILQRTMILI